ncbi:hypothetical protein Cgig2_010857 [Carnegiea gigantea]|uniref:Uncharacterized protein n=1 Tax=Carnegiea gigantea TaxID=171969 RepID=A0A9Q1GJ53_9CARY|nr:hypothetical protein Cgig2_010857 [Carnegiea gigantea]
MGDHNININRSKPDANTGRVIFRLKLCFCFLSDNFGHGGTCSLGGPQCRTNSTFILQEISRIETGRPTLITLKKICPVKHPSQYAPSSTLANLEEELKCPQVSPSKVSDTIQKWDSDIVDSKSESRSSVTPGVNFKSLHIRPSNSRPLASCFHFSVIFTEASQVHPSL